MMETIKEKTQHWEKISANDITDKGFVWFTIKNS